VLSDIYSDFYRGDVISSVNLSGLDHVVSISASQEGKVCFLFACATVVLTPSLPPLVFVDLLSCVPCSAEKVWIPPSEG